MQWVSIAVFLLSTIAWGVYRGFQDRFGPNVIEGIRAYRRQCAEYERAIERARQARAGTSRADCGREEWPRR